MIESLQWLKSQVDVINYDEKMFRISVGDDKYIFGAVMNNEQNGKPDYFSISSVYDTIADLNHKIKYSFYMATECKPSESLEDHVWFGKPQANEGTAIYFIENMVFRTAILWDMLAQLCNLFWQINKPIYRIYTAQFFHDLSQGKNAHDTAKQIYAYFTEEDMVNGNTERWNGNHAYIKMYRDKMTHQNSPNVSTMSSYAIELRPPAVYVLKRATEDFLKASEFIKNLMDEITTSFSDFELFSISKEEK